MIGIGLPELVVGILPVAALTSWIRVFIKKRQPSTLIFSIILVVVDIPHLFLLKNFFNGQGFTDNLTLVALLFGVGCFALGIYGIIFSAMVMAKNNA